MFKKILLSVFILFSSVFAFAGVSTETAIKTLKGRYIVNVDGEKLIFLIRSSGKVETLPSQDVSGEVTGHWISSSLDWSYTSLPTLHLVAGVGSDEDVRDAHIILVVSDDRYDDKDPEIQVAAMFVTFNDGPNEHGELESSFVTLKKYDKKLKRYITLK